MPVLGTKLHVPSPRRQLVPRPRLTDRLIVDPKSRPRLVLVSAPAGFGKTTLMTQWCRRELGRVAWLSLDDDRRRPAPVPHPPGRRAPDRQRRRWARTRWHCWRPTALSRPNAVLVSLVNDLDALAGPTVIALDDYHVIDAAAVHEAVTFLLDHLPPQVTLAITTRSDPPLPLARLRSPRRAPRDPRLGPALHARRGDVVPQRRDGPRPRPAHVAALEARTEGWAAGLQLAALSARGRSGSGTSDGIDAFVEAFTGSHRFVLDYLVEEVLDSQPDDVRRVPPRHLGARSS